MRAAYLYGKKDLRVEDADVPEIGGNEVLLKVKSSFVCGTDVRMVENGYKGISEDSPLIIGHEMSGVIEKAGRDVGKYKEGMRVAVAPNMGCGVCDMCVSGNTHLCADLRALGINLDGGFAEYVRLPDSAVRQGNIVEIADDVSFDEAALGEPLSCVYNAFSHYGVHPGDSVLVIGAGPIGIMHAKLARMAGASKVIMNDISEGRLAQSREIDGSLITVGVGSLKEDIMDLTGGISSGFGSK